MNEDKHTCYISLCSAAKRENEGDLPGIERYAAARGHDVYRSARRDGADFRIFSGKFGLLRPSDPIPCYDHILQPGEVSEMAARVTKQLREQGLRKLVVYTDETETHPQELIYLGCLQVAAGAAGNVTIEHRELSDEGW